MLLLFSLVVQLLCVFVGQPTFYLIAQKKRVGAQFCACLSYSFGNAINRHSYNSFKA